MRPFLQGCRPGMRHDIVRRTIKGIKIVETTEETPTEEEEREYRENPLMDRITREPGFRGGKPNMKSAGVTVAQVLQMLALGETREQLVQYHPHLTDEDVTAALLYAAWKMSRPFA